MSTNPAPEPHSDRIASRLIDTARRFEERIQTANLPVYRASTVLFDTLEEAGENGRAAAAGEWHRSTYGTVGTPTTFALMDALAEIEGAGADCRAAIMPSGLAAITVPLLAFLSPGDRMLMSDSVYGPARNFAEGMLTRYGVETVFYPPAIDADALAAMVTPNTRVLYLESPGSYTFELQDVPALTEVARATGMVSMIDNAWASPVFARPFDWGVDLSLLPLTKYWGGHSDVLMGGVTIRSELWGTLWPAIRQLGICVGGDDAWLILRGMRTADVRMRRHEANALAVARWLAGRPEVARVLHPALPEHPQHALFRRDFSGSSGLFSFELRSDIGPAAVAALCEGRRHFGIGYSWGGFESLIMPANIRRTAQPWQGGQLVRLHIGLEDPDDLIADLDEGFAAARRA